MSETKIVGHKTMLDGSHAPLTEAEASALWAQVKAEEKARADAMPETVDALRSISSAKQRLQEMGWSDARYCPKDGSDFALIQFGCTGIFVAGYIGSWPDGHLSFADCIHHPDGHMWKPLDQLTTSERAKLDGTEELHRALIERELEAFSAIDDLAAHSPKGEDTPRASEPHQHTENEDE